MRHLPRLEGSLFVAHPEQRHICQIGGTADLCQQSIFACDAFFCCAGTLMFYKPFVGIGGMLSGLGSSVETGVPKQAVFISPAGVFSSAMPTNRFLF